MTQGAIDVLRQVRVFADVGTAELEPIAERLQKRTFAAGETVITEGEPGDSFFVIESGGAEGIKGGASQGKLGPGDVFGEIALLTGAGRAATIEATSDLDCYELTAGDFRDVVEGNPSIAWTLLQSMVYTLS